MGDKRRSNFIVQSSILAFSSIIVRIIGLAYRIPLINIIGEEGMAAYAAAFDVYSIMLLISSYSLPLAVSKLVSTRVAVGKMKNAYRVFLGALGASSCVGILVSFITFFGSDLLANLYGSPESAIALRVLAPALIVMSMLGVFRGFFNGLGNMIPTAISQVLEQIANAIISIVAAGYLFNMTTNVVKAQEYGAAGSTLGTLTGAFVALLFMMFIFYIYRKNKVVSRKLSNNKYESESYEDIMKLLLITAFPVILNTTVYNISGLTDNAVFNNIMNFIGIDRSITKNLLGTYIGQYKVITNVPIAFASALSVSIVPTLIASISKGDKDRVVSKINSGIRFSMLIAIPCTVGLSILATPVMEMLFGFGGRDVTLGASMLRWGSVLILFYSLSTLTNSVLQGIDKLSVPVRHSFISFIIHLFALIPLLLFTELRIYAVIIANIVFALSVTIMNAFALNKHLGYRQEKLKTFVLPVIVSGLMGIVTFFSYEILFSKTKNNIASTLISILLSVIVYFVLLLKFRIVTEEELSGIPKGRKILKLAKKLKLM